MLAYIRDRAPRRAPRPVIRLAILLAAALAVVITPARSFAQGKGSSIHPVPPDSARAVLRVGRVVIDGALDDAAWSSATPVTQLTQTRPMQGAPATQRTEVRVLYDDAAIYVGARMYDSLGARGVRTRLTRRDQLLYSGEDGNSGATLTSDKLQVSFDTFHDHINSATFELNPSGVRSDALSTGGGSSWDPVWEGAARVDSLGWTAEMRIPYSQLRFPRDSVQLWGMQVVRIVDRRNERDQWAFWRRNESGGPSRYNHLSGIAVTKQPRQLELLPYVVTSGTFAPVEQGNPFSRSSLARYRVGGDVKYNLTSNLTLDATVNPDFGQVEVDPAVVNLSAYETFYPEKRPFFVANSGAFSFGGLSCFFCSNASSLDVFYSRRIGRPPQLAGYASGNAQYADVPGNSTILGAAKITGRTAKGYTLGLLEAVTRQETATIVDGDGLRSRQPVEPLSNYFVGRAKRDFNNGATTFGGVLTSVRRRLDDPVMRDRLRSGAEAAGLDFFTTWRERNYSFMSSAVISQVVGSPSAILRTQQSSAHYFQRPDRKFASDGLFPARLDSGATALRGYGFYGRIAKDNGNWLWETAQNIRSPGFEVNDLAFLSRAGYAWMNVNLLRQWTVPSRYYRTLVLGTGAQQQLNYDGDRTDLTAQLGGQAELPNYWNATLIGFGSPAVLDDRLTRGGPVVKRGGQRFLITNVSTDARKRAVFGLSSLLMRGDEAPTNSMDLSPSVSLKPRSNIFVSFAPTLSVSASPQQYVTRVSDSTAAAFYGQRYVFASIRQKSLSLDTRLNVTFTPGLTLELFAQPFLASGDYSDFKEFGRPRTLGKNVYGRDVGTVTESRTASGSVASYTIDPDGAGPASAFRLSNPNFNFRSLRGNAVLRWEYRPGSTLFLVWAQTRSGSDEFGNFNFQRDRAALFRDRPTNVFQLKVNYWIGR